MNDPLARSFRVIEVPPLGSVIAGWKPASPGVPRWRDFASHVLILTAAGEADFEDRAGRRARLVPGDVLALFPGVPHAFQPVTGRRWDEFYLICSGPALTPWFMPPLLSPERPVLRLAEPAYWLKRFGAVATAEDPPPGAAAIARMHALIADVLAAAAAAGHSRVDEAWLARARAALSEVGPAKPSLASIARRLGSGEQVFRKRFRALAGTAPGAYREQARLEAACGLLRQRGVAAVAAELGFCDAFHFSRRFRARYGIPPSAFRQAVARG